jgi:hypothetical protein
MTLEAVPNNGAEEKARIFPRDWPPGCPPEDAQDAWGEIYRLVKSNPPAIRDLETHHERGTRRKDPACLRCGLSVFRSRADAEHQSRVFPKLGSIIAMGALQPRHGKTKPTGKPTHTAWWIYEGVDRLAVFESFEEIR